MLQWSVGVYEVRNYYACLDFIQLHFLDHTTLGDFEVNLTKKSAGIMRIQ